MMSENKRNLTEKEEYYKLITDEKSNHIETNANGAGSQCVRRKNIGSLSFRERYLSLRQRERVQQQCRTLSLFSLCLSADERLLCFQRGQNLVEEGFVLSLVGLLELELAAEDNLAGLSHAERHLDGGNLHILTIDIVVLFTL